MFGALSSEAVGAKRARELEGEVRRKDIAWVLPDPEADFRPAVLRANGSLADRQARASTARRGPPRGRPYRSVTAHLEEPARAFFFAGPRSSVSPSGSV